MLVAVYLLIPVPNMTSGVKSAGLNDFTFPTNSNARFIPILYGTIWFSGNILYYGNLQSSEIKACS